MDVAFVYPGYESLGIEMLSAVLKRAGHRTKLVFEPALFDDPYVRFDPLRRALSHRRETMRKVQALEPDLVINARTLETAVSNSLSGQRTTAALLGAFGAVALILAAIGIYGVMAFAVRRRQREIGIRLALGAEPGSVVGLVLRDGVQLALVGLAAGIGLSFALTRLASQFLYVSATDTLAFAGTGTLLLGVSVVACLVPSLRASKVDPIAVLKAE